MSLKITLNGQPKEIDNLDDGATVLQLVHALELAPDRIALEVNGSIAPRKYWHDATVSADDKVELVHFVGGGTDT